MPLRLHALTAALTSIIVGGVTVVAVGFGGDASAPVPAPRAAVPSAPPPASAPPTPDPPTPDPPAPDPAAPFAPRATDPRPPEPGLDLAATVAVDIDGFLSWAALDLQTGERTGSRNQRRTTTSESMIKVWLAADYLRRNSRGGREPGKDWLATARRAIRISHNGAAERLYQAGGGNAVVTRMIDRCRLTDTEGYPGYWSRTRISARDAVRLGECIVDGSAAGKEYTGWLIKEMREVRGTTDPSDQPMPNDGEGGRWGIIDGLPPEVLDQGVAIKNGWTALSRTGNWHVNCLALTDDWVMAVLMQYPAGNGLEYGAKRCASVAEQLVVAAPAVPPDQGLA